MIGVLLDSSAVYALADQDDKWHKATASAVESQPGERVVPVSALTEACYMLATRLGPKAERRLLRAIIHGEFLLEAVAVPDVMRADQVLQKYADANVGFVDASIVAIAERLKLTTIVTTDQRHFRLFRPKHCRTFTILP